MIKIIFTTILTRMTFQELLMIIKASSFSLEKKPAGIQRHHFCHSLNSKNENFQTYK